MTQLTQHSIDAGSDLTSMSDMGTNTGGGWSSNLSYLLIGGSIGATLALLFAPKAGTELRSDLSNAAQKGYGSARDLGGNLIEKADQLTGGAATRIGGQVMDTVSNMAGKAGTATHDLPNGGGELLEGLSDTGNGGRDQGSAKGTNTGF